MFFLCCCFFFKQKTAYEMRISDWSSDVCSSDLALAFIKSSISKMDRLINAILHLSRTGRRQFTAQPVDLNQLFTDITASLAHRLQEADITLMVNPLPQLTSDRLALEQVFSNLLDNAIKYMHNNIPGRIDVTVTATMTHYLIERKSVT